MRALVRARFQLSHQPCCSTRVFSIFFVNRNVLVELKLLRSIWHLHHGGCPSHVRQNQRGTVSHLLSSVQYDSLLCPEVCGSHSQNVSSTGWQTSRTADRQNGRMADWQKGRMANYFCPPCAVVECERECSHGEDYRLVRLSVIHYQVQRNASPCSRRIQCQLSDGNGVIWKKSVGNRATESFPSHIK